MADSPTGGRARVLGSPAHGRRLVAQNAAHLARAHADRLGRPRGIVAASTAATFTGTLAAANLGGDFLLPVVFGVIVGTGIVYGLSARPVALWLGLTRPPAKGVGLIGDAAWVVELARRLRELGVSVLRISSSSPEEVQAEVDASGVPTVSLGDTEARIVDAAQDANVGQVAVLAPSSIGMDLVSTALIEILGRRRVLRSRPVGRPAPLLVASSRMRPPTPSPEVTLQDIDALVEAGAVVEVVDGPMADALPLCAVSTEGTVNLQPGIRTPKARIPSWRSSDWEETHPPATTIPNDQAEARLADEEGLGTLVEFRARCHRKRPAHPSEAYSPECVDRSAWKANSANFG